MTQLNPKGTTAVNIASSIEQLIRNKSWPAGHRLPTVRALADELGVNPNTVSAAYKQLRDAGIIATDGRRGSFVPEKTEILHTEAAIPAGLIDLASGNVDRRLLPALSPTLLESYRLSTDVGNHGDHPELMAHIRQWLQERTGIAPARIAAQIQAAQQKGLLDQDPLYFRPSEHGRRFLNDLLQCFL